MRHFMESTDFYKEIEFIERSGLSWIVKYKNWEGAGRTKEEAFDDLMYEILRDAEIGRLK